MFGYVLICFDRFGIGGDMLGTGLEQVWIGLDRFGYVGNCFDMVWKGLDTFGYDWIGF
jgi:hypothetical protein